jgi:TRAP transporter 4TM/12TM fusion protein
MESIDDKYTSILEKKERQLKGWPSYIVIFGQFLIPFLMFYWTIFGISDAMIQRASYLMITMTLIFLVFPFNKKSPISRPSIIDWVLTILGIAGSIYIMIFYQDLILRLSALNQLDVFFGVIMILLGLEMGRRGLGNTLPGLALFFLLYSVFGSYFPWILKHRGFGIEVIVSQVYCAMEGYYGIATAFMVKYVVMFIIFGAFLEKSGAGKFFIDLAFSLTRKTVGGPAKAAIISSALIGSISGSAIANVMTTGVFTIPMMKKIGYKPHVAAAVEASASNGGQLMPPIMGAVAFIMSEFTGIPYIKIAIAAFLPIMIYYITLFVFIHIETKKMGLKINVDENLPQTKQLLKEGWHFLTPLAVLIIVLLSGSTPNMAGFLGIVCIVLTSQFDRKTRMSFRKIIEAMVLGGRYTLNIGSIVPCIGIVLAIVGLTGLGLKFSFLLTMISGGKIFLAILLVGLISLILGMGLPSGPAYVILAIMAGPALLQLGVPLMVAHMIMIWFSIDSEVTPPIGLAAIAASGIARSEPMKTMLTAWKFSKGLYILPFLFYYRPILLNGPLLDVALSLISTTLGHIAFACFLEGYLFRKTTIYERLLLGISALFLIWPTYIYDFIGILIFGTLIFMQKKTSNS